MSKTFGKLKIGEYIARVEGYKVESAKVINIKKYKYNKFAFTVKGTETKEKHTFTVLGEHTTICGFCSAGPERYYADGSFVTALRDGIEIGFEFARREIMNSFKPVFPYFTVNGRPVEEVESK